MAPLSLAAAPPCRASGPPTSCRIRADSVAALPARSRRRLAVAACARCLTSGRRPLVPALQQPGCRGPACAAAVKQQGSSPAAAQQQQQPRGGSAEAPQQGAAPPAPAQDGQQAEEEQQQGVGVRAALAALRFYKAAISPLLPPACRFLPTCSGEARCVVCRHGHGLHVAGWLRCIWRCLLFCPHSSGQPSLAATAAPATAHIARPLISSSLPFPSLPRLQCTPWRRSSGTA